MHSEKSTIHEHGQFFFLAGDSCPWAMFSDLGIFPEMMFLLSEI